MIKFCVKGDSSANKFFSSSIIIDNLNEGAKKAGLYDENGKVVVYDTTCNTHGTKADAILCVYETSLPYPVLRNANRLPIIGCSLHNLFFVTDVYPSNLSAFCHLGVDSEIFKPQPKRKKDKFRFFCLGESNARSGLDVLLQAFCETFPSSSNTELYIKDRCATDTFKNYVKSVSYGSDVIHDTENTQSFAGTSQLYADADVMVFCSRCTTWGLTILESLSMGVPVITTNYAGPREYCADGFNSWIVNHKVVPITPEQVNRLVANGFRNHMFAPNFHIDTPYWAEPDLNSLKETLLKARNASAWQMSYLSKNARNTAENFSWEKAAASLSCALSKVYKTY